MRGFHLVTELDAAWIPEDGGREALGRLQEELSAVPGVSISVVTGRTFGSAMGLLSRLRLPEPEHLITDAGCALWCRVRRGVYEEDRGYADLISTRWPAILAERLLGFWLPKTVRRRPDILPTRRLALESTKGGSLLRAERELREALDACGMRAEIRSSQGRYLDVLPRGINKGFAVEYLQRTYRLPRPLVCCAEDIEDFSVLDCADHRVLLGDRGHSEGRAGGRWSRAYRTPNRGPAGLRAALLDLGLLRSSCHGH